MHTFERKAEKLAIVGSHVETRKNAPWNDTEFDIWVFNEAAQMDWVKRSTGSMQLHQEKNYTNTNGIGTTDHWSWLQQPHGTVIWMQDVDERVPDSVKFPIKEMIANFPAADPLRNGKGFFTSTPAYALALGLYLGYTTIHTYGVDLGSNTEYLFQANCWRYWCGVAYGMLGNNFKIVEGGHALFTAKLYGYDDDTRSGSDFYKDRVTLHDNNWARLKKRNDKLRDALTDILGGKGDPKDMIKLYPEAQTAAIEYGECVQAMGESQRYAERSEILHRQEFEWHAAKAQQEVGALNDKMHVELGKFEYMYNVWNQTPNQQMKVTARNQCAQFLENTLKFAFELGKQRGRYKENMFYLNEFDQRLTASGSGELDEYLAVSNTEAPK